MGNKSGKTWILLRGLTREAGHWGDFPDRLQTAFPNDKFYPLDLPGTGIYYKQTSPNEITAITEHIREIAKEKGWLNDTVSLLSISLGGMVAWDWLQHYPNEIDEAVILNTSMAILSPFYHRLRWQCYLSLAGIFLEFRLDRREAKILKLISNNAAQQQQIAKAWLEIQQARPINCQNALRQLIAAARYRPKLNKLLKPVLLLSSQGDRLVNPACSQAISDYFSLTLVTHASAGHDISIDDPSWVIGQLQKFV